MWSTKSAVSKLATELMTKLCACIGNPDLEPFTPLLVRSLRHPEEIVETIFKLASTTFVQAITSSALAVIAPLLVRGFNEREIRVKRRTCVVSENLLKLVKNPRDVATFLPVLMPLLSRCEKEVRSVRGHHSITLTFKHTILEHRSPIRSAETDAPKRSIFSKDWKRE